MTFAEAEELALMAQEWAAYSDEYVQGIEEIRNYIDFLFERHPPHEMR